MATGGIKSTAVLILALLASKGGAVTRGQEPPVEQSVAELKTQLDAQAAEIRDLQQRLEQQESLFATAPSSDEPGCDVAPEIRRLPVVAEQSWEPSCAVDNGSDSLTIRYYSDYDDGFVIRPIDPDKDLFELQVNGWIQFRHHAFARDVDSWTDNAGVTRPVRNRNAFDIERGRLIFSGYVLDERLTYFLQMDGDTDGGHTVDFFDYWWAWRFSDRFEVQLGKRKVPASRQWLLTARHTRLVDRPMANDFFRPDRTVGVFGVGRTDATGHYELMAGNGYATASLPDTATDNRLTFAGTNYFDPLGDFGGQIVDYDWTRQPLVRLGHSFVYSPQTGGDGGGIPFQEADYLRLTDGTILTETGALAPGVTVSQFDVYLYGIDAAMKWRGWSFDAEVFLRWIEEIRGDGPLPNTKLFQRGFYVEGGRFLVPQKLDWNIRYSQINGLFGNASEFAVGFNWYPLDTTKMKLSFDVTSLESSPVQSTSSDIFVGDDGTLFRTQFQAEF